MRPKKKETIVYKANFVANDIDSFKSFDPRPVMSAAPHSQNNAVNTQTTQTTQTTKIPDPPEYSNPYENLYSYSGISHWSSPNFSDNFLKQLCGGFGDKLSFSRNCRR